MNKRVFFLLCILISLTLTFAQDLTITPDSNVDDSPTLPESNINEETSSSGDEILQEENNELAKKSIDAAKDAVNEGLSNDDKNILYIPDYLVNPTKLIFNIDDLSQISLELLLILVCFFISMFIVLFDVTKIFSNNNLVNISLTFILCLIASFLGVFYNISKFITNMFTGSIINKTVVLFFFVVIIIVIVFFSKYLIKFFRKIKQESSEEEAYEKGARIKGLGEVAKDRLKKYT